ncbi:MAG: hypothetical protein GX383_00865 [Clostridium sp.]|jgi:hypothetical protein|nr:hypothetical protein [Clostridium sp.]
MQKYYFIFITKKFFTDSKIKDKFKEIYRNAFDDQYPGVYIYFAGYNKIYESSYKLQDTVDDYNTWYSFNGS